MHIFVDPCVLSRIGLGSQVYKVSEPGKPGFKGLRIAFPTTYVQFFILEIDMHRIFQPHKIDVLTIALLNYNYFITCAL